MSICSCTTISSCDDSLLVVENKELKEQVSKLSKSLDRWVKGTKTLDKILDDTRWSHNKEGIGYFPKRGKRSPFNSTRFTRTSGRVCYRCEQVGHISMECPVGTKDLFESQCLLL